MWNHVIQFPKGLLAFLKSFIFTLFSHSCIQQKISIEYWVVLQGLLGPGYAGGEEARKGSCPWKAFRQQIRKTNK